MLVRQLVALRKSGRAKTMPLRQQPARGVDHHAATEGVVAICDELLALALGDELVLGEAVVQLADIDIVSPIPASS